MNLDISKWGKFRIGNLFYKLENGKANDGMLMMEMNEFILEPKKMIMV